MTPLQLALILKTFNSKDVISPHLVRIIVTCVFGVSLCVSYLVVAVSQNLTDSVRSTAGNPLEDQHESPFCEQSGTASPHLPRTPCLA